MLRTKHVLDEPFDALVRRELADPDAVPPKPHKRYLAQGKYVEQLRRLCDLFPRSSVLVLTIDELKGEPGHAYETVCGFLDIDPSFRPPALGAVYNATTTARSKKLLLFMRRKKAWKRAPKLAAKIDRLNRPQGYAELDPALRTELVEFYRPWNMALAEWLGRDLSAWDR
jgi:hypothetical protein